MNIRRLQPEDAAAVVDCFRRVYGDSYANELFYQPERLAEGMRERRVGCVGALSEDGKVIGHMAMTVHPDARVVELGNTVVDPTARGQGLAWQIGAGLKDWCIELGYRGYLHYPTTDHHIMQRQSVKGGFEVGLMLGYIPAETHGQVTARHAEARQAATIVYEPLVETGSGGDPEAAYLPEHAAAFVRQFALATGLERRWRAPAAALRAPSQTRSAQFARRGLARLTVTRVGADFDRRLAAFDEPDFPCRQIDFAMGDPGIEAGVEMSRELGYWFCGWLPGFGPTDVFRMQQVDRSRTDLSPGLVNPVAQALLGLMPAST